MEWVTKRNGVVLRGSVFNGFINNDFLRGKDLEEVFLLVNGVPTTNWNGITDEDYVTVLGGEVWEGEKYIGLLIVLVEEYASAKVKA